MVNCKSKVKKDIIGTLSSKDFPEIVVVRPGALGDTLLTFPVLEYLRRLHKNCRLVFCGSHWARSLRMLTDNLYNYVDFNSAFFAPLFAVTDDAVEMPSPFSDADLVINLTAKTHSHFIENIKNNTDALVIDADITPSGQRHMAVIMVNSLVDSPFKTDDELPLPKLSNAIQLSDRTDNDFHVLPPKTDFAVIHPGSGSSDKIVAAEVFAAIIRQLHRQNLFTVILQGPADSEYCRELSRLSSSYSFTICENLPFEQLAGLLVEANVFIGNDSGVAHLAGMLNANTKVIFKATDQQVWKPLGRNVEVYDIRTMEPEEIVSKITSLR